MKHLLERGVIAIHILEEPLLGELWPGQGLCKGLDVSLHEVVVLGLITSGEVGLVIRLHLLFGGVRSVTTTLKVLEEVQHGTRRRRSWMEWRAQCRRVTVTACMDDMRDAQNLGLSPDVLCKS